MNAHAVAALPVRTLRPLQPMVWLERACHDIRMAPQVGFGHGALMALFGMLLMLLARDRFWLLAGSMSGFLLVAPILATGLYAVSRALERGETAGWSTVFTIWRSLDRRLVGFGLLLAAAGTGWVLTSASLVTGLVKTPVATPAEFLRAVVLAEQGHVFEIWLALGGLLAAPVFASSVVAIPMLLDREISVWGAVLTSWRVVMENPAPLALWGVAIAGFTLFGMATGLIGMLVVVPLLGHASWHAYRDLVRAH